VEPERKNGRNTNEYRNMLDKTNTFMVVVLSLFTNM
jgi:hypothetical protein